MTLRQSLVLPLLLTTLTSPLLAQRYDHRDFNDGLRRGGYHGDYNGHDRRYDNGYDHDRRYDNGYDDRHRGGIGPGKGALIGGAGGAVLGAIFGGGLKGTIIGGAAGAGIGAVVGNAHQNNRRRRY